jgi:hypothetical protein
VGDHAFEVRVLDGVILHVHGQPLFLRVHRRALGHRPALQDAVHLEPEVVVKTPRGMLLDDEALAGGEPAASEGLRRAVRVSFFPVGLELRRPFFDHNPSPLPATVTTTGVRLRPEPWSIAPAVLPCQVS